jgi:hypothetical protein
MPDGEAVGSSVAAIHQNDGVGVGYSVGHCVGDAVASCSKTTERRLDRSLAVSGAVRPIRASRKGESAGSGTQRPKLAAHAHQCAARVLVGPPGVPHDACRLAGSRVAKVQAGGN